MAKRFFTPIDLTGTISSSSAPERSIKWNDGEGTLEVGLKGGNIKLPVGQEEITLCYNGTGDTLTKGTVVYISGAQGQRPRISKASASSESTSSKTFGLVSENIANGAEGFVTTFGSISNVNTSSFTEGSALWLSTTAGLITQTPPTPPNHSVFIGYCLKSNESSGRIFVKVQNGYELEELHNVLITNPITGNVIKYDSSTGLWTNGTIDGGVFEVFYQNSAPSSPQLGDIWVDADESVPTYDALQINDLLPNQSTHSGKFLQTNGSTASWQNVNLSSYATLSSPTFTGIPAAPTASAGTNTTQIATTEFVRTEVANLVASAPSTLDTLDELAAALGDDANYATTISTALGGKEPTISAGTTSQYWRGDKSWQTLDKSSVGLGNVENTALSTWSGSSNITSLGTIVSGVWQGTVISSTYIDSAIARLASPTFTGSVTLPSDTAIGTVSATEIGYLDGVTSAIQTQINDKAPLASPSFTGVVKTSGSFRIQSGELINASINSSGSINAESLEVYGTGIVSTNVSVSGTLDIQEIRETVNSIALSSNVGTLDWTTGNIYFISTAPSANMTWNLTNVPTDNGKAMNITVFVTQGSTGYIPSTVNVNGSAVTVKWPNGITPTPTSSAGKIDIFTLTLIRLSSSWTVIGNASTNF